MSEATSVKLLFREKKKQKEEKGAFIISLDKYRFYSTTTCRDLAA